jgi:hypothetical protein
MWIFANLCVLPSHELTQFFYHSNFQDQEYELTNVFWVLEWSLSHLEEKDLLSNTVWALKNATDQAHEQLIRIIDRHSCIH